jgi:isoleucyl-tRNA synthetase
MRGSVERIMTIKLNTVIESVTNAYESYEFSSVIKTIVPFITNILSSFYLDFTKDIIYIENKNSFERNSVLSVLYDTLLALLIMLNPIIPFTTSEAYLELPYKTKKDVYLEDFPKYENLEDKVLEDKFLVFFNIREMVLKQLEEAREQKIIGKSNQASLEIHATKEDIDKINSLNIKLEQVLIVSSVKLVEGENTFVVVYKALGEVCDRCWNVVESVLDNGLCKRCAKILESRKH